jgi:hypothetical protein
LGTAKGGFNHVAAQPPIETERRPTASGIDVSCCLSSMGERRSLRGVAAFESRSAEQVGMCPRADELYLVPEVPVYEQPIRCDMTFPAALPFAPAKRVIAIGWRLVRPAISRSRISASFERSRPRRSAERRSFLNCPERRTSFIHAGSRLRPACRFHGGRARRRYQARR